MAIKVTHSEGSEGSKIIPITKPAENNEVAKAELKVRTELTKSVKKLYEAEEKAMVGALGKSYDLGEALLNLKEAVGHGGFMKYCTEDMGLNYKRCQRAMDIKLYQPQIVLLENVETVNDAIREANKLKKAEQTAQSAREAVMFVEFHDKELEYIETTAGLDSAAEVAKVVKPVKPWKGETEERNIDNHYKKWLSEEKKKDVTSSDEDVTVESEASIDEIVEKAFADAMQVIDRYLTGDERNDALNMLAEMVSAEVA